MRPGPEDSASLLRLAALTEIESAFLEQCVRLDAVRLEDFAEDRAEFSPAQLSRLRRLQRICRGLDIDVFAGTIIVDLLDRMDALQRDLESLRGRGERNLL